MKRRALEFGTKTKLATGRQQQSQRAYGCGLIRGAALGIGVLLSTTASAQPRNDFGGEQLTIDRAPVREDIALTCAYATECYENEPCQEAGFGYTLTGRGGGMDAETLVVEVEMVSEMGDVTLVGVRAGSYALSGGGFEARHLISIGPDGAARHTLHYIDGPMVISYLGQCLETD